MINQVSFSSSAFRPRPTELDEANEDFINPGVYALELADYLVAQLSSRGYPVRSRCQEDWGHWVEFQHDGDFRLALGCSNFPTNDNDPNQHRIFVEPNKPVVKKLFRKIDVRQPVGALVGTICEILETDPRVTNLTTDAA